MVFYLNILFVTYVHSCVLVWIYVFYIPAYVGRSQGLSDPLALELQVPVRHLIWMLGTNLESYARAENAFMRDQKEMLLTAETSLQ